MSFEKIDLQLWKEIQDRFSKEIGLTITTLDIKGKEVVFSGKKPYYCMLIGSKREDLSDKGLKYLEIPISLLGEPLGKIKCGPIGKDENYDFGLLAERIRIKKEDIETSLKEIKKLNSEEIQNNAKLISIMADIMPKITYRKQKQDNQLRKLKVISEISRKLNSTMELDKILAYVMQTLKHTLEITECTITINDKHYYLGEKVTGEGTRIPLEQKGKVIGTINLYGYLGGEEDFLGIIAHEVGMAITNAQCYSEVKELAVIDKLTGVKNKRYFLEELEKRLIEKVDKDNPVSIILIDLDNFGKYNNENGHVKGDELLKEIGELLRKEGEIIGRYGGEEFIIMTEKKPNETIAMAGRIREMINQTKKITASLGLVICMNDVKLNEAISEADDALYKAKAKGKNQVCHKVWLGKGLRTEI